MQALQAMTTREQAFELCVQFLKNSVIRGDSQSDIERSMVGRYGGGFQICVSGYVKPVSRWNTNNGSLVKLRAGEMAVEQIDGKQCCEVFKVSEVIREIEERWIPTVAKLRRRA